MIADKIRSKAYIINPVFENIKNYLKIIKNLIFNYRKIVTHIHADHISGVTALKKITNYA